MNSVVRNAPFSCSEIPRNQVIALMEIWSNIRLSESYLAFGIIDDENMIIYTYVRRYERVITNLLP